MSTVDLNDLAGKWSLTADAEEHPEERAARLAEEAKRNDHARFREKAQLLVCCVVVLGGLVVSLWMMVGDSARLTEEVRGKAAVGFFAIITGTASFVTGKALGKKEAE